MEELHHRAAPCKSAAPGEHYLHTAYLMSRYPAISHTFFLQEIAGLRACRAVIHTASINPPDRARETLSPAERTESGQTFYLKGQPIPRLLLELSWIAMRHPRTAARGLAAALALEPWHLAHTLYALFYWLEALLLGHWMRRRKLLHLHIHFCGPVASVGMIAARAWKIPYSLTVHGPDEFFDQREMALQQKIHYASFVICISEYCKSQLMRISPAESWQKLHVVRLGVMPNLAQITRGPASGEAAKSSAEQARGPSQTGTFHVVCTGRLVGAKGQGILLLAAAELLRRGHPMHVTLLGHGPDRAALQRMAEQAGIAAAVTFAGALNHDAVLERLAAADLFVLPSFAEGVPVALMEAMAMGIPCISTFVAGIPELIRHEKDGLLVPAGSVKELTEAMQRLLLDPEQRTRFAASAREQVLTHYNLPRNLEKLAATMTALAPYALAPSGPFPAAKETAE